MKTNVGGWDRNTRFIVGTAAVVAGLVGRMPTGWKMGLLALGATELITASTRYCPVNEMLGINTKYDGVVDAAREAAQETMEAIA